MYWTRYDSYRISLVAGPFVNLITDDIWISLHTSLYIPNKQTHDFFDDVSNEISGSGYAAGGLAVSGRIYNNIQEGILWRATDSFWPQNASGPQNARVAVLRSKKATAALSPLIAYGDLGRDMSLRITPGLIISLSDGIGLA